MVRGWHLRCSWCPAWSSGWLRSWCLWSRSTLRWNRPCIPNSVFQAASISISFAMLVNIEFRCTAIWRASFLAVPTWYLVTRRAAARCWWWCWRRCWCPSGRPGWCDTAWLRSWRSSGWLRRWWRSSWCRRWPRRLYWRCSWCPAWSSGWLRSWCLWSRSTLRWNRPCIPNSVFQAASISISFAMLVNIEFRCTAIWRASFLAVPTWYLVTCRAALTSASRI